MVEGKGETDVTVSFQAGRGGSVERMIYEVEYKCGCSAAGNNVASYCPIHGSPTISVVVKK